MNDFISNVIARDLNLVETIQPKPVSLFESMAGDQRSHPDYYYGPHKLADVETAKDAIAESPSTNQIPTINPENAIQPTGVRGTSPQKLEGDIPEVHHESPRHTENRESPPVPEKPTTHRTGGAPTQPVSYMFIPKRSEPALESDETPSPSKMEPEQASAERPTLTPVKTKDEINGKDSIIDSAARLQPVLDPSWQIAKEARNVPSGQLETAKDAQENDIVRPEIVNEDQNQAIVRPVINRIIVQQHADSIKVPPKKTEDETNIEPKNSADEASQWSKPVPTMLDDVRAPINPPLEPPPKHVAVPRPDKEVHLRLPKQEISTDMEPPSIGADHSSAQTTAAAVVAYPQVQPYIRSEIQKPYKLPSVDEAPHTVNVTIGRIEVRAVPAQKESAKKKRPKPPVMSLDEYLHQRAGKSDR